MHNEVEDLINSFVSFSNILHGLDILKRKNLTDYYRVVYGGDYTILLNKSTGERVCSVKREKGEKNNLRKAVLYLVLKLKGVYGTEIEKYFHSFEMTKYGLMLYLLQYGYRKNYTPEDIDNYMNYINLEDDPEVGFMYIILLDRFNISKFTIDNLVADAVCSETDKTRLRLAKKRKYEKHARSKRTAKAREEIKKE